MGNICRALELAAEIEDLVAAETLDQFCLELLAQGASSKIPGTDVQCPTRCWLSRVPTTCAWCRPNPDNLVEAFRGRGAKVEHMSETRRGTRIRQPGQRDRHVQDRRPLLAEYIR